MHVSIASNATCSARLQLSHSHVSQPSNLHLARLSTAADARSAYGYRGTSTRTLIEFPTLRNGLRNTSPASFVAAKLRRFVHTGHRRRPRQQGRQPGSGAASHPCGTTDAQGTAQKASTGRGRRRLGHTVSSHQTTPRCVSRCCRHGGTCSRSRARVSSARPEPGSWMIAPGRHGDRRS